MLLQRTTRFSRHQLLIVARATVASFLCRRASPSFTANVQRKRRMSEIKQISTPKAAQPVAPYSQAVAAGNLIFVSGQIPARPDGSLVEGSITEQTTACCEGMKNILEAAGSSLARITKVTVFLTSMDNFAEMNSVYEKYFGATKPARSCVAVKELPKGVPVELECIALTGN